MTESFRVVTINTGKGDGPFACRLSLLAAGLLRLNPDVVLLQEALATCDDSGNTLKYLAERLDMRAVYAPARHKHRLVEGRSVLCSSGLGVLSRDNIAAYTVIPLPEAAADGERIGQLVAIERSSTRILLANVHLSHLPGQDGLRRSQFSTMLAHPWFREPWSARLIGGDLNISSGSLPTLREYLGCWSWRDGYVQGGGPEPRATIPVTAPAEAGKCVDFILSISQDPAAHPRFEDAAVVLHKPAGGVYPSDHRGVMTTVVAHEEES